VLLQLGPPDLWCEHAKPGDEHANVGRANRQQEPVDMLCAHGSVQEYADIQYVRNNADNRQRYAEIHAEDDLYRSEVAIEFARVE
jgi:hypothetical protein